MQSFGSRRLSCGIVIVTAERELLLCHVTGQNHWDLPKGGIDAGEAPVDAALRETREETGLQLDASALVEIGRLPYTPKKSLHLFAALTPRLPLTDFRCETYFFDRYNGRRLPEMDGYGWFGFDRIASLCTAKMTAVLTAQIDLDAVLRGLAAPRLAA